MYIPPSRLPHLLLSVLLLLTSLLFLHQYLSPPASRLLPSFRTRPGLVEGLEAADGRVRARVERMRGRCDAADEFEREYGRTNLRLSRAYEGSHETLRRFLHKLLRGEDVTIAAIGGSVTKGHHVWESEIWFSKFGEWLDEWTGEGTKITKVNGAAPATGSDYFSFCFPLHIPTDADLILVELAVNDEALLEHVEDMENLLRGLLDLPKKPAVVLVEAMAFSNGGMGGGGGRMHLPVAQYYDVPVINQRHPLATHFARFPQLVRPYFAPDYWGNPDTRHVNARGHRDLGMLVASLVKDVSCSMLAEPDFHVPAAPLSETSVLAPTFPLGPLLGLHPSGDSILPSDAHHSKLDALLAQQQSTWPEQSRSWRKAPAEGQTEGELMPGMWETPLEYGLLPSQLVLSGWNPDPSYHAPPFRPTCLSTRSKLPKFNLTPVWNEGWDFWVHEDHLDKPYLVARRPGARVTFELETGVGVIKMYSLRSKTFGLGTIECWVDAERDKAVKIVGWWDSDMNIGRFTTIREGLPPGRHEVTCQLLRETSDPEGGTEFRMISIMSV